jgi:hypothetical protein
VFISDSSSNSKLKNKCGPAAFLDKNNHGCLIMPRVSIVSGNYPPYYTLNQIKL